jgi:hypothetical protein
MRNVYQLRPLAFSLGLNNPRSRVGNLYSKSRTATRYEASNRGALNVKWRELEFSLLPSSALKCVPRNAKGLRWLRSLWRYAVQFYQGVGIPQYIGEWRLAFCSMFERGMPRA